MLHRRPCDFAKRRGSRLTIHVMSSTWQRNKPSKSVSRPFHPPKGFILLEARTIVSSLRPPGRQAFTCAHEFGHHVYGHGDQFDELVEDRRQARRYDSKEFEADCFASALLMPKTAVLKGLAARGWNARNLSPERAYRLASWLGVGYLT